MSLKFNTLADLTAAELNNFEQLGYTAMTAIQEQALPKALAGKDLIAQAKTGSGKTAAFGIPLLHKLNPRFFGVQGLCFSLPRELATQVLEDYRNLRPFKPNIKFVVFCGVLGFGPKFGSREK